MELFDLVSSLLGSRRPPAGGPDRAAVVALVGAGGKTSALFALATEAAARGAAVLVTTTTKIHDPREEGGRPELRLAFAPAHGNFSGLASPGAILLVASALLPDEGKLAGVAPETVVDLAAGFDLLLVEADGARRLPVKAPGPYEPVMPPCADLVIGCIGLDCLGAPIGPATVHRSELFAALVGSRPGETISPAHLATLALAEQGLFKSAPPGASRLVALNKAELLDGRDYAALLDHFGRVDVEDAAIALCSFAARSDRILALRRGPPRPSPASV